MTPISKLIRFTGIFALLALLAWTSPSASAISPAAALKQVKTQLAKQPGKPKITTATSAQLNAALKSILKGRANQKFVSVYISSILNARSDKDALATSLISNAILDLKTKATLAAVTKIANASIKVDPTGEANIVAGALTFSGSLAVQQSLITNLATAASEEVAGLIAEGAVQASGSNAGSATALITSVLNATTVSGTGLGNFAATAATGNSGNSGVVGAIAQTVASLSSVTTDAQREAIAVSILNAIPAGNQGAAALTVSGQVATLVSSSNQASFAQSLAKSLPALAQNIAAGVTMTSPANAGPITAQVIISSSTTLANAAAIAGATTRVTGTSGADSIAQFIAQQFAAFPSLLTSATSINLAIDDAILNLPSPFASVAGKGIRLPLAALQGTQAQTIANVAAILLSYIPARSPLFASISNAVINLTANLLSAQGDTADVANFAATLYATFKILGNSAQANATIQEIENLVPAAKAQIDANVTSINNGNTSFNPPSGSIGGSES